MPRIKESNELYVYFDNDIPVTNEQKEYLKKFIENGLHPSLIEIRDDCHSVYIEFESYHQLSYAINFLYNNFSLFNYRDIVITINSRISVL